MRRSNSTWMVRGAAAFLMLAVATSVASANVKVEQAIAEGNRALSAGLAQQDVAAIMNLYTEDAVMMPGGGPPLTGLEAIQSHFDAALEHGLTGLELKTSSVEVHGKHALEMGSWSGFNADGDLIGSGSYMVVWVQEKGAWKIHRDIFNNAAEHGEQDEHGE